MKLIEFINKYLNQYDFCPDYLATGENNNEVIVKYETINPECRYLTNILLTRNLRIWENISISQTWEADPKRNYTDIKVFRFNRV